MNKECDFWASDKVTLANQRSNPKAIRNRVETIKLIDSIGGLSGAVLDIGYRNLMTEILEKEYQIKIDSN